MDRAATWSGTPVTVLTGFLGSGKTTLLRRVLTAPAFADTAVIINEVGEIAIDHYLVDFVEGEVLELPGGCLCCAVREDLAQTLRSLIERRDAGEIRRFRRIVIETSGLADPAPVLFTLGADPMLDQRLVLGRVVTLVDAVTGAATLERFAEASRQAAVADALVISKTDLAPFDAALAARLDTLNPNAERIIGAAADPAIVLFGADPHPTHTASPHPNPPPLAGEGARRAVIDDPPRLAGEGARRAVIDDPPQLAGEGGRRAVIDDPPRLAGEGVRRAGRQDHPPPAASPSPASGGGQGGGPAVAHSHGIAAFTVVLGGAVSRLGFARALGGLAMARGNDLLRVKGIVRFADRPANPAIVQAAQHAMFTPEWLDGWPDDDHRSRLVFIVHDIAAEEILDRFAFASPTLLGPLASRLHAGGSPAVQHGAPHR